MPGRGRFWVPLALRSTLSSQVTRVQPGSPASGCNAMQLSRVSALWRAKKGSFRGRGSLWGHSAGSPSSPGALPDAALLCRQPLEAHGGAHQVDGRLRPPAVPHADEVPAAHGAGAGHLVCHQRVLTRALQHLRARRARSAAVSHPHGMLAKAKRACLPPRGSGWGSSGASAPAPRTARGAASPPVRPGRPPPETPCPAPAARRWTRRPRHPAEHSATSNLLPQAPPSFCGT